MSLPNSTLHGISYKSYLIYKNVCPQRGGGGYSIMYAYFVRMCSARETPIFSPEFLFRSISFSQFPPNPFRVITILLFWADFAVPETIFFFIRSGASPFYIFWWIFRSGDCNFRNAKRLAAGQSASARRVLAIPESIAFHAQNGSSSFRSPSFLSSKRLKLVPETLIFTDLERVSEPLPMFYFTAAHNYLNLGRVSPSEGGGGIIKPGFMNSGYVLISPIILVKNNGITPKLLQFMRAK